MIISHAKRFAMFLPWKTASQTMLARLLPYNQSPYGGFFEFNPHLNRVVHQHMTCSDFLGLPESKMVGYFIGSFVRNPYDRAYSGFRQLQKDIEAQPSAAYRQEWVRKLVLAQLEENLVQLRASNFDFDTWIGLLAEHQIYEAGRNTNFPLHPSHYWTHVGGKQFVQFIGKVENFERDFAVFTQNAGINETTEINANVVDLKGSSSSNQFGYRYTDRMNKKSIDKINSLFSDDFSLFGYDKLNA